MKIAIASISLLLSLSSLNAVAQASFCADRVRSDVERVAPGALDQSSVDEMCANIARSEARAPRFIAIADDGMAETTLACGHAATGAGFGGALMLCYDWKSGDVYGLTVAQFGSAVEAALGAGLAKINHPYSQPITGDYACGTASWAMGAGVRLMACTQYGSKFSQTLYYGGLDIGAGVTLGPAPIVFLRKF